MLSFTQFTPTEIVFGKEAENQTAALVKKHGGSKVLVVYGKGSVVSSGLLDRIAAGLKAEGIEFLLHGGATPNPHLSFAQDGAEKALVFGADLILAVGGGSAIDAAKAIAHGTANPEKDIWKFWLREEIVTKSLPVGVVLTISAAGSETSNSAVITNVEARLKRGINTDFNRPKFAIMNPELTYTLPKFQIACGIADIMMHSLDRYFSPEGDANEMTDEIAEAVLRVVIKHGPKALAKPDDYQAQSEIMWAGSLSHNGITGLGRTMDFSVHQFGHELGGRFDTAHGASLTATWASWARHSLSIDPARFARYARNVWGVTAMDDVAAANEGIDKTEAFFKSIEMPTCFSELGIGMQSEEMLEEMAFSTVHFGTRLVGAFNPLDKDNVLAIYKAANH